MAGRGALYARIALITLVIAGAIGVLIHNLGGTALGVDLRGILEGARAIAHGADPYRGATAHALLLTNNPYVLPPLLGELLIPLSWLPFNAALAVFDLLCALALVAALWALGVRDRWVYVVALASLPMVAGYFLGQPDALFALTLALAWRLRDHPARCGLAVGFLIAAKLLLWPLVVWLVLTRRVMAAFWAAASGLLLLAGSWAVIGFQGLGGYLHRLSLDAQAFAGRSHSVEALVLHAGGSAGVGEALGVVFAIAVATVVVLRCRERDLGWFGAGVSFGVLSSPLLWTHYLVALFVPLAVARRRLDAVWLATAIFYVSPQEPVAHAWQIAVVLAVGVVLALGASRHAAREEGAVTMRATWRPWRPRVRIG